MGRFGKRLKRKALYNRYYEIFDGGKTTCQQFFRDLDPQNGQPYSLLTKKFDLIKNLGHKLNVYWVIVACHKSKLSTEIPYVMGIYVDLRAR
jgi:hypothetical protein